MTVDGSGIAVYPYCPYAQAAQGTKLVGVVSGLRLNRDTFLAVKCGSEILDPVGFKGTDKSVKTRELIEKARCSLSFSTLYSPYLSPIKK